MKAIERKITSYSWRELVNRPKGPRSMALTERHTDYGSIEVMSDTINIVLSRDIRENSHIAAEIAVDIARKHAGRDVWYLNTYSGEELLESSFNRAFGGAKLSERSSLPNFRAVDIPMGYWSTSSIVTKIEDDGREKAPPVLVLNSFEHSFLTRGGREKIAMELVRIQRLYNATIVIFSHQMKNDLHPGYSGRGAMGLLATCADRVERLTDKYEHLMGQKKVNKGIVHEKQTQIREIEVTPKQGDVERGRSTLYVVLHFHCLLLEYKNHKRRSVADV